MDGKAHYVALNARDELANYPAGAVVEVKGSADVRAAGRNIAALANDGLYRTDHHLAVAQGQAMPRICAASGPFDMNFAMAAIQSGRRAAACAISETQMAASACGRWLPK